MPRPISTLSQSSLQDYTDCPHRFELRVVKQLVYPAIETEPAIENEKHQQEGEYFHRLAQQYFMGIPPEQIEKFAGTENLQRWWQNFITGQHLKTLGDFSSIKPELPLSAPLGQFRLVAKYDLVAIGEEKVLIYDWKTYRKRPRSEWLSIRWQTRVYRALLAQAGPALLEHRPIAPEQIEMIYWFPDFPSAPAHFGYQSDQFKRDWGALERLADEISGASHFPKTEDVSKCAYCPYRSYCSRGVEAGKAEDNERDIEAEEFFDIRFEQIDEIEF